MGKAGVSTEPLAHAKVSATRENSPRGKILSVCRSAKTPRDTTIVVMQMITGKNIQEKIVLF